MKLNELSWPNFLDYLLFERNYKNTEGNISSVKTRFEEIKKYFSDKEFTRENFRIYLKLLGEKYANSTVNKYITVARRIEQFLDMDIGLKRFAYRSEKPADFEALTVKETEQLAIVRVNYGRDSDFLNLRNQVLYLLSGINGGNRISEALNLKWEDVRNAPKPHVIFRDTKSRKDRRVYLSPTLWNLFQQLPRRCDYVFSSYRGGKKLRSQEVNNDLKRRAALCGIEKDVHYHLLRHTYATEMSENPNISPMDTADIMGYSDPKTILERYKRSTLDHTSEVILSHPALRGEKTPEMVSNQLIQAVTSIVDPQRFPFSFQQENGEVIIRVKGLSVSNNS